MKYLLVVLFFCSPTLAKASDAYTESKRKVWKVSCECTFLKLFLSYGNGSKANKEMSKDVSDICRSLIADLDKRSRWSQISSPTESGCFAAIKVMADSNPGWEKKPQDLFATYCVQLGS